MTKKTLAELRAETDRLMYQSLHKPTWPRLEHQARIAALAAERDAADFEIKRLRRALKEAIRALAVDPRFLSPARLETARSILVAALAGEE